MGFFGKIRNFKYCVISIIILQVLVLGSKFGFGDSIIIPGKISQICQYANFSYNYCELDFLYYFNDLLLFREKPDDLIVPNGIRNKILALVKCHWQLKDFIEKHGTGDKNKISFQLNDQAQYMKASHFLYLLGYRLKKDKKQGFVLNQISDSQSTGYLRFSFIKPKLIEKNLNQNQILSFELKETEIELPNGLTHDFLSNITGKTVNQYSLFEKLLSDEHFSLFLGAFFRLSNNEVEYMNQLIPSEKYEAWHKIYNDKKLLMSFFVFSNAFRVKRDSSKAFKLDIPGGEAAQNFWSQLAGVEPPLDSFEFIKQVISRDDGKLNYLYLFSYFLSEELRKTLFFNYDAEKVQAIYNLIKLFKIEKISKSDFPALNKWSFFTLLYTFQKDTNGIILPGGADAWMNAISGADTSNSESHDSLYRLIKFLVGSGDSGQMSNIRKFMNIYSKFSHRPQLLQPVSLSLLYNHFEEYNGLVDFIEKIPIKNPKTVEHLFSWVKRLESSSKQDKILLTMIFQSLFEILSFTGKYSPNQYNYDLLVTQITQLPLTRAEFYQGVFDFFKDNLNIKSRGLTPFLALLKGISNSTIEMGGAKYKFAIKDSFRKVINNILQSQEVCTFADLLEINRILKELVRLKAPGDNAKTTQLLNIIQQLPYPGMSEEAPKDIRDRVMPYKKSKMQKLAKQFVDKVHLGVSQSQLESDIKSLKGDYLIYLLRDHLLALAYSINAKSHRLKVFLNPNFVRLHDILGCSSNTLWDNRCKRKIDKRRHLSDYSLQGGLSRLNILFSSRWLEYLLKDKILFNPSQVQALIVNLLDLYPIPQMDTTFKYKALTVELGLELLRGATENPSDKLKQQVSEILCSITSGYHYRRVISFLNGNCNHHNLYFSEIQRLGERYLQQTDQNDFSHLLPAWEKLKEYKEPPLLTALNNEMNHFGTIYTHTFGNLIPRQISIFPQDISTIINSGWLSGNMINEFKIKLAYHMHRKKIPAQLLGQLLIMYLQKTGRNYLHQNHYNDYSTIHFIFDIFNTSHLNRLLRKMKEEGYLKLK